MAPTAPDAPGAEILSEALAGEGCLSLYPLRTERLLLRPLGPEDMAAVIVGASDPEVARHTARIPHPYTPDDARRFIEEAVALAAAGRSVTLVAERRGDGRFLGVVGFDLEGDDPQGFEIGYWFARDAWGQGFATEAVRAVLAHAFDDLHLTRACAHAALENPASARVLEKAGFENRGTTIISAPARLGGELEATGFTLDAARFAEVAARPVLLVTAVALLDPDNRVLLQKRPEGKALAGLWEFPGGKVHDGETPEKALIRELHEELGIDVRGSCLAPLTFASHTYDRFHLLMPLYVCRQWKGRPTGREGQELAWVPPAKLTTYAMPPADIPLIPILQDWLL